MYKPHPNGTPTNKLSQEHAAKIASALVQRIPNPLVRAAAAPYIDQFVSEAYACGFCIGADDVTTAINTLQKKMKA